MFEDCFAYLEKILLEYNGNDSRKASQTFRKRFEHTKRVVKWIHRLSEGIEIPRFKELIIAAIFHDIGYISLDDPNHKHAMVSAEIFRDYAAGKDWQESSVDFIVYLIKNHSNKQLLNEGDTPIELIILIEADKLDEEGAMAIVWDCLALGTFFPESYEEAYFKIKKYAGHILNENFMVTENGKRFWEHKQEVVKNFLHELEIDLDIVGE